MKFIRRPDLDISTRFTIALKALSNMGEYGYITHLAETYKVSRTFIYSLVNSIVLAFYLQFYSNLLLKRQFFFEKQSLDNKILLYRLEGNSSLESISNMLHYNNISPSSVGHISERLKYFGSRLSNTLELNSSEPITLIWLNDEIFAHTSPILATVDPISMAILRVELAEKRDAATWNNHFHQMKLRNFHPINLCSDRGTGIVKASEETFENVSFQPDIFHDLQELSKIINGTLQRRAYKAINHEYERKRVLTSAKSIMVELERRISYDKAKKEGSKAVELYDDAHYLFGEIRLSMEFIDEKGNFLTFHSAKENILTALELLKTLNHSALLDAAYTFESKLDEVLQYMNIAQQTHNHLSDKIADKELLSTLCLAWKYDHKIYQNPEKRQKKYLQQMRDFNLECAQILAQENYKELKEYVFRSLDTIIRASSLVEAVNSLIRPYLNTCKGQITQEMLNLIMFYHNHRKFNHGKRQGKAPIEILTGQELEKHWVDLLIEKAEGSKQGS
jgi:hypothetical protein